MFMYLCVMPLSKKKQCIWEDYQRQIDISDIFQQVVSKALVIMMIEYTGKH